MRTIDALIAEMEQEGTTTSSLLERVPTDKLDWSPHAKSMTLGKLASHIAFIPLLAQALETETFDLAAFRPSAESPYADAFQANLKTATAILARLDDDLSVKVRIVRGEKELMSLPRVRFIRGLLMNHNYHHRGQLSVYLRMLDVPLPPIYGPTADVNPFA